MLHTFSLSTLEQRSKLKSICVSTTFSQEKKNGFHSRGISFFFQTELKEALARKRRRRYLLCLGVIFWCNFKIVFFRFG
jgi:hypothetical protein